VRDKGKAVLAVAFFLILLMASNAVADEVRLKNGGVLPGKIVGMEDGKLVLKTSYAGEISIEWSEVATLRTDSPVHVVIEHDTYYASSEGIIELGEDERIKLKTDEMQEVTSHDLATVKSINAEAQPSTKMKATIKSGIDIEKGNTDKEEYHLDGELIVRTELDRYTIRGEFDLEKSNNKKTDDNWKVYGRYDYFLANKWFLTGFSVFEKDQFKDIDLRSTLGGGVGYQFFEEALKELQVQAGLSFVFENFIDAEDDEHLEGIWALEYDRWLFEKKFKFYHKHMGFVGLEDIEDWRVETITGFQIPVYRRLAVGTQFDWDYDNTPSSEEKEWDWELLLTVGWNYEN